MLKGNSLTIQVPNNFFYEWLEENYVGLLKKSIREELGPEGRLEYQIVVENHKQTGYPSTAQMSSTHNGDEIRNPFVIPGIKKVKIQPQLNSKYRFGNFIEGDCNKLARSAGMAISKNPGGTAFNPLVIFGDVGLGKTHLAHAIGNEVMERFPKKNTFYISTERFANQIIESIKKNSVSDLVNFYQSIDLLIVDDIQFLKGKAKTQEIFFNIFNQLHQLGKQIVLTSDRPPKSLEGIQDRLISRFKWGLSADLQAPDFETRMAILEAKIEKEGVALSPEVSEYISFSVKDNVRELEGVLISLIAQSTLNNKRIDLELAKRVVDSFVSDVSKKITIENIKQLVAEHFKIPLEKLQGKTRKREVVIARQLSMYLAKNHTNNSLKTIGTNFGGRDHSTVIYSCRTVQDLMDTDLLFKDTVYELEKKVQLSLNQSE
jgi:chromosomal replication initiator protein